MPIIEPFNGLREQHDREGLSSALLRAARDLTVTTYEEEKIRNIAERLTVRRGRTLIETDHYLLCDPSYYDERQGLRFDVEFDGIT